MTVRPKTAGPKLEFGFHQLLSIAYVPVRDAIGIGRANRFNPEL
jgi:hypothetical protein